MIDRQTLLMLMPALTLLACGSSNPSTDLTDASSGPDSVSPDLLQNDDIRYDGLPGDTLDLTRDDGQGLDLGSDSRPGSCFSELQPGDPFLLWPNGDKAQIHASSVLDGNRIWIAFNAAPEGSSSLTVFVMSVGCDGISDAPIEIADRNMGNQTDPTISVSGSSVLVAWMSDNGQFPNNMDIRYRVFESTTGPGDEPVMTLEPVLNGAPAPGSVMMPAVAPRPGGGWAIAASHALEGYPGFQSVVTFIDSTGKAEGESLHVYPETSHGQTEQSIAVLQDNSLLVAWTSETKDEDSTQVVVVEVPVGQNAEDPVQLRENASTSAAYLTIRDDGLVMASATSTLMEETDIWVKPLAPTPGTGRDFGTKGQADFGGIAVLTQQGGATFWYRNLQGFKNDIYGHSFKFNNGFSVFSDPVKININPAAPYGISSIHVVGELYFVAWSEGTSPDFQLAGRFVEVK